MHPIKQLKRILDDSSPSQGRVVSVGHDVRVSTTKGVLSIQKNNRDATRYRVGDSVILANGTIVGRRLPSTKVYVM